METKVKNFIESTNTTITSKYVGNKKHFIGETDYRDVYKVTITTPRATKSILFGQSLNDSNGGKTPPTEYDILATLQKYDVDSYEDFKNEYGYDDTKDTKRIYKAVAQEYEKVCTLWSTEEIEMLLEIY